MTFPLVPSPLGGVLGASTASFFKLTPLGVPFEPLIDVVPGVTPFRITFDMVDNENVTHSYDVTEHAVQTFFDVTSNVRKRLVKVAITGTLSAVPPLLPIGAIPVPGSFLRLDLLRIQNLEALADSREPIMVVTPRFGLPKCIIADVSRNWNPGMGESSQVSIALTEARIVSPLTGITEADFPAQAPGNNAAQGGGQSATTDPGVSASAPPTDASGPTQLAPPTSASGGVL